MTSKKATPRPKDRPAKKPDADKVAEYMAALEHPLKAEIEVIRVVFKSADTRIGERIKWNAPSYYYTEDLVTFQLRATEHVHLVFHHPLIETIPSPVLEGDYKGRRMAYFKSMEDVKRHEEELVRILRRLIAGIDGSV
jgi:hypothetical protein